MSQPDFEGAKEYIADWLRKGLPDGLLYHGYHHTLDDVVVAVERLADLEAVEGEERLLLLTAAHYHDSGFLEKYGENEKIATNITRAVLPRFGYDERQIHTVCEIIMATQLPQSPANLLQEIMCDGDLDSLGREDFFLASHRLRLELAHYERAVPLREWYDQQLLFLQEHHYFTKSARALREEGKQKNMAELRELLYPKGVHSPAAERGASTDH